MASNHWPKIVFQYVNVLPSTKCEVPTLLNVMHPHIITPKVASLEVERCRLVAILRQLFCICTPCYPANFYLRFIAEYHSMPVTIYRQVPLSSTPSCPVSLVDLPNPNHLLRTTRTAMVACFEQHSLHSRPTLRHSSVSVLIKFCRDFFQRCRSVIFDGSDQ